MTFAWILIIVRNPGSTIVISEPFLYIQCSILSRNSGSFSVIDSILVIAKLEVIFALLPYLWLPIFLLWPLKFELGHHIFGVDGQLATKFKIPLWGLYVGNVSLPITNKPLLIKQYLSTNNGFVQIQHFSLVNHYDVMFSRINPLREKDQFQKIQNYYRSYNC